MLLGVRSALAKDTNCRCPWLRLEPAMGNTNESVIRPHMSDECYMDACRKGSDLLHERQLQVGRALPRYGPSAEHVLNIRKTI